MDHPRFWRLERLIPLLLATAFATDAAARFVRLETLAFRGDEAVSQFKSHWLMGPFEGNRQFRRERINGDLSSASNRFEQRVFRPQVFTTDEQGFRNAPRSGAAPPEVMIVGSSFTMGGGNTDADTLPSQVAAQSGCRVYNAGYLEAQAKQILKLTRALGMERGLILVEALERYVGFAQPPRRQRLEWLPYRDDLVALMHTVEARFTISPMQVVCRRWYKSLQDGLVLPNIYNDSIQSRALINGQSMLFLLDLEVPKDFNRLGPDIEIYARLRDELRAAGFDLGVVIVPDKLTVYRSLLRDPPPDDGKDLLYLERFEQGIRSRQIPVVNVAPLLEQQARPALAEGRTLYWADDTHWNREGIAITAQAVCDSFQLRERCARGSRP